VGCFAGPSGYVEHGLPVPANRYRHGSAAELTTIQEAMTRFCGHD
jgi:hypothetical protein